MSVKDKRQFASRRVLLAKKSSKGRVSSRVLAMKKICPKVRRAASGSSTSFQRFAMHWFDRLTTALASSHAEMLVKEEANSLNGVDKIYPNHCGIDGLPGRLFFED